MNTREIIHDINKVFAHNHLPGLVVHGVFAGCGMNRSAGIADIYYLEAPVIKISHIGMITVYCNAVGIAGSNK